MILVALLFVLLAFLCIGFMAVFLFVMSVLFIMGFVPIIFTLMVICAAFLFPFGFRISARETVRKYYRRIPRGTVDDIGSAFVAEFFITRAI